MKDFPCNIQLIAPCGMNCGVCIAYLRDKKPCSGCRTNSINKPNHCINCRIVHCKYLAETKSGFCFDCIKFPCSRMKQLDARYRKNYHTSLIENLNQIKTKGIEVFLESETQKWTCPNCNNILSIHRNFCINCNEIIKIKSED